MRFEVVESVDRDEWQEVADRCGYATFFHTPGWAAPFVATDSSMRIRTCKFSFTNGSSAIFPMIERRTARGLSRLSLSAPAGCYGGWISSDSLNPDQVTAMTDWIVRRHHNIVWRVNPLDPHRELLRERSTSADSTELLMLESFPDEESLWQNYRHSVRKQVGKSIREGMTVRLAEDWSDWARCFELYEQSIERWGTSATNHYPLELFRAFFELPRPNVKLWLVAAGDKIVGGNLNFYQSRHCVEWHASFDEEYLKHGIRNFLVHHIIRDAHASGFEFYDFNPSGGHAGSRAFKQTFGTATISADMIERRNVLSRIGGRRRLRRLKSLLAAGRPDRLVRKMRTRPAL